MTGLKDRADRPMYESSEDAMYSARTDACARRGGSMVKVGVSLVVALKGAEG